MLQNCFKFVQPIKEQCSTQMETIYLVCSTNQLNGSYLREPLLLNFLKTRKFEYFMFWYKPLTAVNYFHKKLHLRCSTVPQNMPLSSLLTLSWLRFLSYRNLSRDLRYEWVNLTLRKTITKSIWVWFCYRSLKVKFYILTMQLITRCSKQRLHFRNLI